MIQKKKEIFASTILQVNNWEIASLLLYWISVNSFLTDGRGHNHNAAISYAAMEWSQFDFHPWINLFNYA